MAMGSVHNQSCLTIGRLTPDNMFIYMTEVISKRTHHTMWNTETMRTFLKITSPLWVKWFPKGHITPWETLKLYVLFENYLAHISITGCWTCYYTFGRSRKAYRAVSNSKQRCGQREEWVGFAIWSVLCYCMVTHFALRDIDQRESIGKCPF